MENLWHIRLQKIANRFLWSLNSNIVPHDTIETLHERSTPADPNEVEFVRQTTEPALIEPLWGYVISEHGYLYEDSMATNETFYKKPWRIALPSYASFTRLRFGGRSRVEEYEKVIHLRHFWEWNYYHLYIDVLSKLQLFDQIALDANIPIVLGRYALEFPFVQQLITMGAFANREWIIQDHVYIRAKAIYYCRTKQPLQMRINYLLDNLLPNRSQLSCSNAEERIFISRQSAQTRRIINFEEIQPTLTRLGFRIVDPGTLPIAEQIALFAQAKQIVGIHGAGLTNIIFRGNADLKLLEICPSNYQEEHFKELCQSLGYRFERFECAPDDNPNPQHANLYINPEKFAEKLLSFLEVGTGVQQ